MATRPASHHTLYQVSTATALAQGLLPFSLFFRGHFDSDVNVRGSAPVASNLSVVETPRWLGTFALACLLVGLALALLADSGWARALGIVSLCVRSIHLLPRRHGRRVMLEAIVAPKKKHGTNMHVLFVSREGRPMFEK